MTKDRLVLKQVMEYFNLDTTTVPQVLYELVFNTLLTKEPDSELQKRIDELEIEADWLKAQKELLEKENAEREEEARQGRISESQLIIADQEIERLKGLLEKAHDSGYDSYEKYSKSLSWLGFKTDNNL